MAASHFHAKPKNDPLSRMTAYQELKSDAKDGETIVLFSWMTKLFVIFLEVVPVLAKMFFAPPSVYAARVQARVSGDRLSAQLSKAGTLEVRQPQAAQRVSVAPAVATRPTLGAARVQPRPAATGPVVQPVRSNPGERSARPVPPNTAVSSADRAGQTGRECRAAPAGRSADADRRGAGRGAGGRHGTAGARSEGAPVGNGRKPRRGHLTRGAALLSGRASNFSAGGVASRYFFLALPGWSGGAGRTRMPPPACFSTWNAPVLRTRSLSFLKP